MIKKYVETRYYCNEVYREYYVGETADIKAMYKSIARNKITGLCPEFEGSPKFSDKKSVYALCIDEFNYFSVVNSDTMLSILLDNNIVIVEVK